jgi:hypothetical protein
MTPAFYVSRGLHLLRLRGKDPDWRYSPHAVHSAVCSTEAWDDNPTANIGIAIDVGALEGVRVVDIDPKNGGHLRSLPGVIPDTPTQITGSGGWHFLVRWPSGSRPKTKLLPGVELLGPGRYFVAAPSIHPNGSRYTWAHDLDYRIVDAPDWLVNLASHPPRPPRPRREIGTPAKYARGALISAINRVEAAGEGGRNDMLFKETVAIARFARVLGEDLIADALIDAALVAGLREREAEKTVMSALRKGMDP